MGEFEDLLAKAVKEAEEAADNGTWNPEGEIPKVGEAPVVTESSYVPEVEMPAGPLPTINWSDIPVKQKPLKPAPEEKKEEPKTEGPSGEGPQDEDKKKKKLLIPFIIGAAAIVLAIIIGSSLGGNDNKKNTNNSNVAVTTTSAATDIDVVINTVNASSTEASVSELTSAATTPVSTAEENGQASTSAATTEGESEAEAETDEYTASESTDKTNETTAKDDTSETTKAGQTTAASSSVNGQTSAAATTAASTAASTTAAKPAATTAAQTTKAADTTAATTLETTAATTAANPVKAETGTPYGNHGKLSVSGTNILDQNGNIYQLKGVSTHGIAWFPDYVNKDAFKTMRDEWGINVVRLAMYSAEYNGYCTGGNQTNLKNLIDKGVQAATELGLYVIIDWHVLGDQNPKINQSQAIDFFKEMSKKYAGYGNVIFEICNEPNGGTTWADVKSYANEVIPVIRANSDNIIIVGTPEWSQRVDQAAADPITGQHDIMYALHFYAATHGDYLRTRMEAAIGSGLPVFISEYGICDASGNGGYDIASANAWMSLADKYHVSSCIWNLSNKAESSSLIVSSCSKKSGWTNSELSGEGQWFVGMLGGSASGTTPAETQPAQTQPAQTQATTAQQTTQAQTQPATTAHTHSFSPADCYNPGRCDCGETSGSALGHDFGNNNQTCSRCGTYNPDYQEPSVAISNNTSPLAISGTEGTVNPANGWKDGDGVCMQYTISGAPGNSVIKLSFDSDVTVSQIWCGEASVSGKTVTITTAEYGECGFIIKSDKTITIVSASK